jgi:hypothetical protein
MTVSSTTSKVSYTGNGSTTAFAVPFYFLAAADLQVILRSGTTETVQALTTNYTVAGAGVEAGGTVTMLVAPASGTTLTIRRSIAATQGTDLLPNDRLPAEDLEDGLDKLTMIAQQLGEESDRSIKYPASDAAVSAQLPAASARASKFLTFDSNGLPVATVGVDATLDIFTQSGTGAVSRSVTEKLRDSVSVLDFGAIGDGATDDTAAVQLAVNASKSVFFPAGKVFRVTAEVVVPAGVHLYGNAEIRVSQSPYVRAIRLGNNCTVDGLTFRGTGVSTAMAVGLLGGQLGMAIAAISVSNVRVLNCKFYDFVTTALNTGAAIVSFYGVFNARVSGCYFDETNDGNIDIDATYTTGDCICDGNVSYSNSDLFISLATVGFATNISGTQVSVVSHHIVSNNIHIKNRWATIAAGRSMGRHGVMVHYGGGLSYLTMTGNIIGNVSRHGVYMRGSEVTGPEDPAGPNLVSGNFFLYCGNALNDVSNYHSGIRCEVNLPTVISSNHFFRSGYLPSGVAGAGDAYDVETVRGVSYLTVSDNVMRGAKNGAISLNQTVSSRITRSIDIHNNKISNSAFGIFIGAHASSTIRDVRISGNQIDLTGATYLTYGYAFGIGFEIPSAAGESYNLDILNNTVSGLGKTSDQFGLTIMSSIAGMQSKCTISNNLFRQLETGLSSWRATANNVEYIPHRTWGVQTRIVGNKFQSCGTALQVPKNASTHLAFIDPSNIFDDCTTTNVSRTITWDTVVLGCVTGIDSSGNVLSELQVTAIPTAEQYYRGEKTVNPEPAASGFLGSVCTTSGTPGTWKTYGAISA